MKKGVSKSYKINTADVVHETTDSEVVILNLKKGAYYSLNKDASKIWFLISEQVLLSKIIDSLKENQELIDKTEFFIKSLIREGLIIPSDSEELKDFTLNIEAAPEIKIYSDLEDLLLLDPIHDVDDSGWPDKKQP